MSTAAAKSHEPSMEEILASIRRIIADDEADPASEGTRLEEPNVGMIAVAASPVAEAESPPVSDELPAPTPPPMPTPEPISLDDALPTLDIADDDLSFAVARPPDLADPETQAPVEAPEPAAVPEPVNLPPRKGPESLISTAATASVGHAFDLLSKTILSQNARTLEDLVQDMLKPMLREWLDDNLPPLVERLVRAEIERVARGR